MEAAPLFDLSFVQTNGTSKLITFEGTRTWEITTERLILGHSEMEATGPANDRHGGEHLDF